MRFELPELLQNDNNLDDQVLNSDDNYHNTPDAITEDFDGAANDSKHSLNNKTSVWGEN